mmetsp:Transcript_35904/g.60000  ORF Transcript_35904/g.60000 Transcript_35904/m.60000 type:complete len:82 (-) Transcript_35904:162-407(-)
MLLHCDGLCQKPWFCASAQELIPTHPSAGSVLMHLSLRDQCRGKQTRWQRVNTGEWEFVDAGLSKGVFLDNGCHSDFVCWV